jgi:hypothetical protein
MARNSWLIPDFALEKEGKSLYDQMDFRYEGGFVKDKIADTKSPTPFEFNIFIGGTVRLYRVGLAKPYVPLFLAVVSVAALRRENRKLFNTKISNSLTLLLFPFETYREYLQTAQIGVSYADIESFIKNFAGSLLLSWNKTWTTERWVGGKFLGVEMSSLFVIPLREALFRRTIA